MGFSCSKKVLMAGTALLLVMGSGDAFSQTVVNGADVPIGATDTTTIQYLTDDAAIVSDTYNVTATVTNDTGLIGSGVLTFLGTSTVGDSVGAGGDGALRLVEIDNTAIGKTVTFSSNVYASEIVINGTGNTIDFNGPVGGKINLGGSSTSKVILGDGANVTGNIYSGGDNLGTLTIEGGATIDGTVGVDVGSLSLITVGALNESVTFTGAVETNSIDIAGSAVDGSSIITFESSLDVATDINYTGTSGAIVNFDGAVTVGGAINLTGDGTLNFDSKLDVGGNITYNAATTISVNSEVVISGGTGFVNFNGQDGSLILGSGVTTFDSNIDNTVLGGANTVTVLGDSTINGNIGATNAISTLEVAADGATSEFTGTVNVSTVDVTGDGQVTFSSDLTADNITYSDSGTIVMGTGVDLTLTGKVDFNANDGELVIAEGSNVNADVDNSGGLAVGTLTLGGGLQSVSGKIGETNEISVLNSGTNGATATTLFSDTVNADTINIKGDSDSTTTFASTLTADTINIEDASSVELQEGVTGDISFAGDGVVTISTGKSITGNVDATAASTGNIVFEGGTQQITGTVGATNSVNTITSAVDNAVITIGGNVNANDIDLDGLNANATFGAGLTATTLDFTKAGAVLTVAGAANVGALTFAGTSTVDFNNTLTGTDFTFSDATTATFDSTVNLATLTATGDNSNLDFDGDATITTFDVSGANAVVDFAKTVSGTALSVSGAGSDVVFNDMATVTTINVAEDGGTADFKAAVNSTDINLLGTGAVTFAQDVTGNVNFTGGNGSVSFASGADLTGSIVTSNDGTGQVTLVGAGTVSGAIGDNIRSIATLTAGTDNNTVTFSGSVYADDVDLAGNDDIGFGADLYSLDIDINGSGQVGVAGDLNTATLDLNSTSTLGITGDTTATNIDLHDAATVVFGGDVINAAITGAGVAGAGIGNVTFAADTTAVSSIGVGANNVLSALTLSGDATTVNVTGGNVVSADTLTLGNNTLNISNGTFTIGDGVTQTIYVNLYADPTLAGKIVTSDGGTVGAETDVVISVDTTEYVADGTEYVIFEGSGSGNVSNINSITGLASAMISYVQDTDNTDDLVIRAVRTRLETYVTTENSIAVANALDEIALTGDDDMDALQLAIQEQANLGNNEEVQSMISALVSSADGGVMTSNLTVGAIVQGVNEGRLASIRLGDSDYNDGYYGGEDNYTPNDYYIDNDGYYNADDFYYDTGLSAGAMVDGYSFWMQGYARDANQDHNEVQSGYDAITYGVVFGVDTSEIFEDTIFGLSFGYGKTNLKSRNENRTKTDVDNYGFNLYSNYDFNDNMFLDAQLAYGYNSVESRRYNVGPGLLTAQADYHSHQYMAKFAMGYDAWLSNGAIFTPVTSASYAYLYNEPYEEQGAGGAGLEVASTHMSVLELGIGAKLATKMESLDGDTIVKPKMHAMYNYNVFSDRLENFSNFVGAPGTSFVSKDADIDNERINLGLGIDYKTYVWTVSTNYDYEYREDYQAHSGAVKLNLEF